MPCRRNAASIRNLYDDGRARETPQLSRLSMIPRVKPEDSFSENRYTPRIKSGAGRFGIML